MTYLDSEKSINSGEPVELHHFSAASDAWKMTSAGYDITHLGHVYTSEEVLRTETRQTDEFIKQEMEVRVPRNNRIMSEFIEGPPEEKISYVLYRGHETNFEVYWRGNVSSAVLEGDEGVIRIASAAQSLTRKGLSRKYQIQCNHPLYGFRCMVIRASYNVTGVIGIIDGVTVTASEFATKSDGWFVGGDFVVGTARRLIIAHSTNTITLARAMRSTVLAGQAFTAYAGCDHSWSTCGTKFNNRPNYGGCPFIPVQKNPFKGDALL